MRFHFLASFSGTFAVVAQKVERLSCKQRVGGSTPSNGSKPQALGALRLVLEQYELSTCLRLISLNNANPRSISPAVRVQYPSAVRVAVAV